MVFLLVNSLTNKNMKDKDLLIIAQTLEDLIFSVNDLIPIENTTFNAKEFFELVNRLKLDSS